MVECVATALDEEKSDLLTRATELALGRHGGELPPDVVDELLRDYFRHVASEDVCARSASDLYGALASHYDLARMRPQGTARLRLTTPGAAGDGWSAGGHSVVEVVTDDMPFLVDSLTMALTAADRDVHLVIHPQVDVVRDITGRLKSVAVVQDGSVAPADDAVRESWMHIEITRVGQDEDAQVLERRLQEVLRDVRESVEDWNKMNATVLALVDELSANPPPGLPAGEVAQTQDLLRWLAADHFTFLGYREYHLETEGEDEVLRAIPGTGLGILRADQDMSTSFGKLPAAVRAKAREKTLLVLAKANSRATVHRPAYLDYIGVKSFDANGEVTGERRFLGLFSSAAYTESIARIPLLREKAREVIKRAGFDPRSHAGKALMDTLETYPRDELFHTPVDELTPTAQAVMYARERRQLKMFVRRDTYGRYVSALVYLPRDRYNTNVREKFVEILKERLGGDQVEFTVRVSESNTANVHFVVHPPKDGHIGPIDVADLERRMAEASRSWRDDFVTAAMAEFGEERGARLARRYADSFPEAYKEDFAPETAVHDLGRLEGLHDRGAAESGGIDLQLFQHVGSYRGQARLKVFRLGAALSLSQVLPMLSSMGVEVLDERPYELDDLDHQTFIYEFGLSYDAAVDSGSRERFQDALHAIWDGRTEIDGFNALVLRAGLSWRQAAVLRAYAKYMKQGNSPFALDYIEGALLDHADITGLLVKLFEVRFDPAYDDQGREEEQDRIGDQIRAALDDVASLDHDRILRS
jgi:glutamate dehydrogenase